MNCVRCGVAIDPERLEFLPDTVTCAACSRVQAVAAVCDHTRSGRPDRNGVDGELAVLTDDEAAQRAKNYIGHRLYRPDSGAP